MAESPFFSGRNMAQQEPWARRGEDEGRLAALETSRILAYAEQATTTIMGNVSSETDLPDLNATFTLTAERWVKITMTAGVDSNITGDTINVRLREVTASNAVRRDMRIYCALQGAQYTGEMARVLTLAPGVHTFKMAMQRVVGTGTSSRIYATSALLVEAAS